MERTNNLDNMTAANEGTVGSAIENALEFLKALGYGSGGDIFDELASAAYSLRTKNRPVYDREIEVA